MKDINSDSEDSDIIDECNDNEYRHDSVLSDSLIPENTNSCFCFRSRNKSIDASKVIK